MAWETGVEIYVQKKTSEATAGDTVAYLHVPGDNWSITSVEKFATELHAFKLKLQQAIAKYGADKICIRTNT